MAVTRVWLTRHAESANPVVFHGAESDIDLGARGVAQAHAAVSVFRQLEPTLIVTSAMRRAIATAEPTVRELGVRHVVIPDFHERRVGKLGGTSFDLTVGPWAETLQHWQAGDTAFTTDGAESFDELQARLVPAWHRMMAEHAGERIVVVTHGVVVKVLLLMLLPGWGPKRWSELGRVHNLALSELVLREGDWHAESLLRVPPEVAAIGIQELPNRVNKSEA